MRLQVARQLPHQPRRRVQKRHFTQHRPRGFLFQQLASSNQHYAPTHQQRRQQLKQRDVKRKRRHTGHHLGRTELIELLRRQQRVLQLPVLDHHSLRPPRRTRRIDHIGQRLRCHCLTRIAHGLSFECDCFLVQTERLLQSQPFLQYFSRQHQQRHCFRQHQLYPWRRLLHVQRQVRGSCFPDPQQRHHTLRRPLQTHRYQLTHTYTTLTQQVRDPVRRFIQLPITQFPLTCSQRHCFRCAPYLLLKQLMRQQLSRKVTRRVVHFVTQVVLFSRSQQRHFTNPLLRIRHDRFQQLAIVHSHPLDRLPLEDLRVVLQYPAQPRTGLRHSQRQVEVRRLRLLLHQTQFQPRQLQRFPRHVLQPKRHLEERRMTHRAHRLQLFHQLLKRQVLMRIRSQRHFPHPDRKS